MTLQPHKFKKLTRTIIKTACIVCIICFSSITLSGCSSDKKVEKPDEIKTDDSKELALDIVKNYFEKQDNLIFTIEDAPVHINNNVAYSIRAEGVLVNKEPYPIDTFAVDVENQKTFFWSPDSNQYTEFSATPYFVCENSPDGKYRAENIGMTSDNISGISVLKNMRVINCETGDILWSENAFINNRFLWSSDSKYLGIQYSGRQWTEIYVLDSDKWSIIYSPAISDIIENSDLSFNLEDAAVHKIELSKWISPATLECIFSIETGHGTEISGTFKYDIENKTYFDFTAEESQIG